jgi:predicted RNA-binding protein Jag
MYLKEVKMTSLIKSSLVAFSILFLVSILLPVPAFCDEEPIAHLTDFSGTVLINSQGSWAVKPAKNLPLYSMDKVVTRIGNANIIFNDGAILNIKSNSNLLVREIEKKEGLIKKVKTIERKILLFLGKMHFKTGKSDVETRFETTKAVIGIRGTEGILSIGADGKTYIHFSEGGAKFILGEFIRGIAKEVRVDLADQNPVQRATFVAKAAADQIRRTEKKVAAKQMPPAQLDLAKAIAKETSALEILTYAESMLISPDEKVLEWARQQIENAKETIKAAKEDQRKAIENGADPKFKGFTRDDPGFDVPSDQSVRGSQS